MLYYESPKKVNYPCKWKPTIVPGERAVYVSFGAVEITTTLPSGTIDEEKGTCSISLVGESSGGFILVEVPGEIDGTLLGRVEVPKKAVASYL